MAQLTGVDSMLVSFLLGIAVGALLLMWRNKFSQRNSRRIPRQWPIKVRPFVNNREKRVWAWLAKVMFDHQILVKLPVTRFTSPTNQGQAGHWYQLLNGVYCTFTICTMDGKVIGCVDVPGPRGISLSNQTLKHTLLMQCGLHYWVVDPAHLPHLTVIRKAFLGEEALPGSGSSAIEHQFNHVREHLQAAVSRQRGNKSAKFAQLDAELTSNPEVPESRLSSGWEQNSFVTPLDSRAGDL
ncbi:MAG: hypothetical protein CFE43_02145 [Burkholderiales bacterium PBB3]|nr:MAG: hypothetical protein CFE43_02145 [Burkholderiales bacterium PBB3]